MAIGLISGLKKLGIECPRDISVIGFDDIGVSENYAPPLTTMRQPREQIGRIAAETLINILEGQKASDPGRCVTSLQSELIRQRKHRGSTCLPLTDRSASVTALPAAP
jgi:LacI family repressor for deo operon, udp, cdd, tsx, nupC, and nupG